jgi:hypothetical protein
MVIVQLTGGLGNQLFQYAAGKSLALSQGSKLKCDLGSYGKQGSRSFDLNCFKLDVEVATREELESLQSKNLITKALQRTLPPHKRKAYREPHFHFDPSFFSARKDIYLKGNWQSERYFKRFEDQIKNEFEIKEEYVSHLEELASSLMSQSSISVHIRRGDYLQQQFLQYHGVLSAHYYNEAIKQIAQNVTNPKFYFFSDDIQWVMQNLDLDFPHEFISGKATRSSIEDFYLMQSCQHNIIANSSFSWWAAWLNRNPGKNIVAPRQWFQQGPKDTYDLLPDKWIKV